MDADVTWRIGSLAKEGAKAFSQPIVIDISSDGQLYFQAVSANGTSIDNGHWIRRKPNTVLRFRHSSYYMGRK